MESAIRAFVAVELSAEVRRWLAEARASLEKNVPSGSVRWTNPDGIHVTLKFLGDTPAPRIDAIRGILDRAAEARPPFSLTVEGLGCFPAADRPRVIWAGVRRQPDLWDLQARLEEDLERAGFPRERRAFSPHLTLGRVRDGVTGKTLADVGRAVASAVAPAAIDMPVAGWCLFKSVLRPEGAEYSVLHRTALKTAA